MHRSVTMSVYKVKYKRKQRAFLYNFNYPNKHFDFLSSLQSWAIVEHILLQKEEEGAEGEGREKSRERGRYTKGGRETTEGGREEKSGRTYEVRL